VDGPRRFTYAAFFERCDRASAAFQRMGVKPGDRVATLAPNTAAHLECFYSVPQIGAVLVPINFRLTPEEIAYILEHSGARVLCAHADYLESLDAVRARIPGLAHGVALEGARRGWRDYEAELAASGPDFEKPTIGERDLLTLNYTSGTTARPKGVMITHRNAHTNVVGTLLHHPMSVQR